MSRAPSLAAALTLALLAGSAAPARAAGRRVATLAYLLGVVEIARAEGGGWLPASLDQGLFPGDRLRTGEDGRAEVRFGGGSRLRLDGATDVSLPDEPSNRGGFLQHVEVFRGGVWADVRVLDPGEGFQMLGGHSQASVRGTRFQLRRGASDRWRLAEGRLWVEDLAAGGRRQLLPGQRLEVGSAGAGAIGEEPLQDMEESYTEFDRVGSSRWQETITKILAAQRRLVQRATRNGEDFREEALARSEQLGQALEETRRQIQAFVQDRGGPRTGATELRAFADRSLQTYARLDEQLRSPGPALRPAGGAQPAGAEPGAAGAPDETATLGEVRNAAAFLQRFSQALRRTQRVLRRSIQGSGLRPAQVVRLRDRIVGGYRQSERTFQRARDAVRRLQAEGPAPRVRQAFTRLQQTWRRIGRDFRITQSQLRKAFQGAGLGQPPVVNN